MRWRRSGRACGVSTSSGSTIESSTRPARSNPGCSDRSTPSPGDRAGRRDDLEAIVTYDERMIDGARLMGLTTVSPR
jgi:hypothetical protein